jgi:hypothetical protein
MLKGQRLPQEIVHSQRMLHEKCYKTEGCEEKKKGLMWGPILMPLPLPLPLLEEGKWGLVLLCHLKKGMMGMMVEKNGHYYY